MLSFINSVNNGSVENTSQSSSLKKFLHNGGSIVGLAVAYRIHIISLALWRAVGLATCTIDSKVEYSSFENNCNFVCTSGSGQCKKSVNS